MTKELQCSDQPESKVKLEEMIQSYYKIRGWTSKGVPTNKRLKKLGLFNHDYS
jgi:aldehyde:ferredoxin oxidoreductase